MNMEMLKRYIQINTETEEEKQKVGSKIHGQLVGNKDYINSNIVINIDEPCSIRVLIFKECKSIPEFYI